MILTSKSGLMCAVKLIRETRKAWFIEYRDDPGKQHRKGKDVYGLFDNTDAAQAWIEGEHDETD